MKVMKFLKFSSCLSVFYMKEICMYRCVSVGNGERDREEEKREKKERERAQTDSDGFSLGTIDKLINHLCIPMIFLSDFSLFLDVQFHKFHVSLLAWKS